MRDYKWYFWTASDIFHNKGLSCLLKKSARYAYRSFRGDQKDRWKKSETDAEYCHEKVVESISGGSEEGFAFAEAFLHRIFHDDMNGYSGLPSEYIHLLLECIKERQIFRDFTAPGQDDLLIETARLDPSSLPSWRWLALQYICIRNGFFKTSGVVRKKAIEIAYIEAEKGREPYIAIAFRAAIDQAEFDRARLLLDRAKNRVPAQTWKDLESYLLLNTGDREEFRRTLEREAGRTEERFRRSIEGKSVAIIGPAPSGDKHGEEIDSFDLVVRINYNGRGKIADIEEFGSRTDISYYNITFSKEISVLKENYFDELKFAVFKRIEHDFQRQLIESGKGRAVKYNHALFNGTPLGGSHALFDILHFRPERVKLFNVNFYLSRTPYHPRYFDGKFLTYFETFNFITFAHHDIMSNLNFTRNLWKAGLIEVDNGCREVISKNTSEYLSAMEEVFLQDSLAG